MFNDNMLKMPSFIIYVWQRQCSKDCLCGVRIKVVAHHYNHQYCHGKQQKDSSETVCPDNELEDGGGGSV